MSEFEPKAEKAPSFSELFGHVSYTKISSYAEEVRDYLAKATTENFDGNIESVIIRIDANRSAHVVNQLSRMKVNPWEEDGEVPDEKILTFENKNDIKRLKYFNLIPGVSSEPAEPRTESEVAEPESAQEKKPETDSENIHSPEVLLPEESVAFLKLVFDNEHIQLKSGAIFAINLPELNQEQKSELFKILNVLNIYPDLAESSPSGLAIFVRKDIEKMIALGLFTSEEAESKSDEQVDTLTFPTRPVPKFPNVNKAKRQTHREDKLGEVAELDSVDEQMHKAAERFYAGLPLEDDTETKSAFTKFAKSPFKQEYQWRNKILYTMDGELIPSEEHMQILAAAETDEKALGIALKMHEGLVGYVYANLTASKKPNFRVDADDVMQSGRIGLVEAIRRHDQEKFSGYQGYFIKYIENEMRVALKQRRPLRFPEGNSSFEKQFFIALKEIRTKEGPQLEFTPTLMRKIARVSGLKIEDIERLGPILFGHTLEEFDEENGLEYEQRDLRGEELHTDEDDLFEGVLRSDIEQVMGESLNSLPGYSDIVLRLRFGIIGGSDRWKGDDLDFISGSPAVTKRIQGVIENLKNKRLLSLQVFTKLTPAERLLAAIVGSLSEKAVADLIGPTTDTKFPCTLEEVAQILGVTRERIRQIEAKGMRLLKHPSRTNQSRTYLDE